VKKMVEKEEIKIENVSDILINERIEKLEKVQTEMVKKIELLEINLQDTYEELILVEQNLTKFKKSLQQY
jgi:hypothetical protein